ncbi:hypothetical protein [Deinococcus enclensis]|uniref:DUF3300 domain-containing protein n=1 Tax=Deinococcus enclensis TaxID=1049582 RepID=A0ABT9MIF6_9DEIO|nr:hypothetical protein [Deinococcus enclensis]MDP9766369.1 hypothetical protein [Deinococcus enclensis]
MNYGPLLPLSLLTGLASAQQNTPRATPPQMTTEMRTRMAQMQPITDLAETVRLLPELEKNKATAVTRTQAKSLLSILTALQKAAAVQPNDAKKYLAQIEDKILTSKQLTALDSLLLKAEEQRAASRAQAQRSGQTGQPRIPGMPLPGMTGQGQNRTRQGGQNQAGQGPGARQPGQFNPFKQGRTAEALTAYMKVLQKK